ncbi:AAA family ATPase [Bengtsoniella intestinalis]|uniref:ATP-dependent DNA helicase n=1 Tax=Bengtsoniella intestinalis TaxID=3073143 RepID=UPI00391F813C
MAKIAYHRPKRGDYILDAIDKMMKGGDSFVYEDALFQRAQNQRQKLSRNGFELDLACLFQAGKLYCVGRRIYHQRTLNYEQATATKLAELLLENDLPSPPLPDPLTVRGITLDDSQRRAVSMALSHRLSIILGGAGSGKTTLLRAIAERCTGGGSMVLCAPTGKAACNLTERTAIQARTVHSALSKAPDEDFLKPVDWSSVRLVLVDEASMMTLELLTGILHVVKKECRVVLVGDPNQLLSVGAGNVLPDLLQLGVPRTILEGCHRQDDGAVALKSNVVDFKNCAMIEDLKQDDSFQFIPLFSEAEIQKFVTQEGAKRYLNGENFQVLSPRNFGHPLSVEKLNLVLRKLVNPAKKDTLSLVCRGRRFFTGDRVMVTKNDWDRKVCNGHIGTFGVCSVDEEAPVYGVATDHAVAMWEGWSGIENLTHAYAITIHKSQGSEYDTVIIPVHKNLGKFMYRNLLYTAISRAKQKVILVGDPDALAQALRTPTPERKSVLVAQTNMKIYQASQAKEEIA